MIQMSLLYSKVVEINIVVVVLFVCCYLLTLFNIYDQNLQLISSNIDFTTERPCTKCRDMRDLPRPISTSETAVFDCIQLLALSELLFILVH